VRDIFHSSPEGSSLLSFEKMAAANLPCALPTPVGLSHWKLGLYPRIVDDSTLQFDIHPDAQVLGKWGGAQLHRLFMQNLQDKDFIRSYRLFVRNKESGQQKILSLITSLDLQKSETDLYPLDFLWQTPLLLDWMKGDELFLECKTIDGAAVNVVGPHADGNTLTLWLEVAPNGTDEWTRYSGQNSTQHFVGPFRYQSYRYPSTWILWYKDGHLEFENIKPYRVQSSDPFSDEAFYDSFWPSAEDSLATNTPITIVDE
jgi:hypothetical protein